MREFAKELANLAVSQLQPQNVGAFYGGAEKLSPGAGIIYGGVEHAFFNIETGRHRAQQSFVLILTHECDIDPANNRDFNDYFTFAPLILLDEFANAYAGQKDRARSLITAIAQRQVNRLIYLPPPHTGIAVPEPMRLGALVYWNNINNTHVSRLSKEGAAPICAVSQHGMIMLDYALQQHFLRSKSEVLPRTR